MKRIFRWMLLAFLAWGTQGCISVAPLGSHYGALESSGKAVLQAEAIHKDTLEFLKEVRAASSTPQAAAYVDLNLQIAILDMQYKGMKPEMNKNTEMNKRLLAISKGRSEMRSDQPDWDAYMQLRRDTMANIEVLRPKIEAFNHSANVFTSKMNAAGVNRYEVAQVQGDLDGAAGKVKTATDSLRASLAQARDQISKVSQATLGLVQYNKKKELLNKIEASLPGIDAKAGEFKTVADQFRNDSAGKKKVYSGPGIQSPASVDAINKKVAEFKALTDPVQVWIAEFNAK